MGCAAVRSSGATGMESSRLPTEPRTEQWSTATLVAAWGGSRTARSRWRGALELVFGPCGAQVTRAVCGMRPDPAEGGMGLSSGLSVLSPQPWDNQPRVSPALVRLQPAPRAKLVGAAAVKGE